ncbi:MAG: hypothetical protein M1820_007973 [Bogoriella megaspora]|nr:MAG: hypothetical protein M1820_007973 [Bogoriella megaspora]
MPTQGFDASSSTSPKTTGKRAPIRIQPTGYRRPSQGSAHQPSNPTSPTPRSPVPKSPTPKSPTSYNYTPRTPTSPKEGGPASPTVHRPRLSSRTKSAPLVATVPENGSDAEEKTPTLGLGLGRVTTVEASSQPRIERAARPGAVNDTSTDDSDRDERGSEDGKNTRPSAAVVGRRRTSGGNSLNVPVQGSHTPPTSPRRTGSPKPAQTPPTPKPQTQATMPEINIGVLGAARVGKSTFMQRALDLATPPPASTPVSARKMSVDGNVYVVRLFELGFDQVEFGGNDEDENIIWPEKVGDMVIPKIDGALALYDVTNQNSLAQVPGVLNAIHKASLPCVLVSCKCDNHPTDRQVDPNKVEQRAKSFVKDISTVQTARTSSATQKQCMSVILRSILSNPDTTESQDRDSSRRRALSNAVRAVSPRPPDRSGHARATSEHSGRILMAKNKEAIQSHSEGSTSPQVEQRESVGHQPGYYGISGVMPPQLLVRQDSASAEKEAYTFDELVDKLLAQAHSKAEAKFVANFLTLFRKFTAPGTLLEAIISRFEKLHSSDEPEFTKTTAELRCLTVIENWAARSPEDFVHPWTRQRLTDFIERVGHERIHAMAAKEIQARIDAPIDDDDSLGWAFSDSDRPIPETVASIGTLPSMDFSSSSSTLESKKHSHNISTSTLTPTSSATSATSSSSNPKPSTIIQSREAARLNVINPQTPLSKVQWHAFMSHSDEAVAKELTRINWISINTARPRDVVRHVSLTPVQRADLTKRVAALKNARANGVEQIERGIVLFNHLAGWIKNLVLLRDKPKHRALMLEKMMRVARRLREMNNYASLGAFIAALGSSQITRLVATRDLVPESIRKDFLKLEILMSSQKSYFAYRLAWENSPNEKIPYFPISTRDLVVADSGSRTFLDDETGKGVGFGPGEKGRVNWKKFEIMGEALQVLQRAQSVPYPKLGRNEELRQLLLETIITKDDDELHERSVQLEPTPQSSDKNLFQRMRRR